MSISLILAAGGLGTRFLPPGEKRKIFPKRKDRVSKLFLSLNGQSILETSLLKFFSVPEISEILVVLPKDRFVWFQKLIQKNHWKKIKLVQGGASRAESVYRGLQKTNPKNSYVMVHDAARPLVPKHLIHELIEKSKDVQGMILGKRVVPTIKKVNQNFRIESTVDRSQLYEAQTPQIMRRDLLLKAYQQPAAFQATDESSLLEFMGHEVKILPHEEWNPKITTFQDLKLAQASFLPQHSKEIKVGFGTDLHRLVSKRPFYLGGVRIPFHRGPLGHSDGDVLLHAISDAVLGALGLGDIGQWFSDRSSKFKNLRSEKIVQFCFEEASKRGWKIDHVDTVIHLEKPKLASYKEKIKLRIAKMLKVNPQQISIKAKTMEGLGPIGENLAISSDALVTLSRTLS